MAVKLRLMRMGKKKSPYYRVVVMDGRSPRDGRYIDQIGRYDPREQPSIIEIDNEKAVDWLRKGAQPTDPVRKLLEQSGAWSRYKVVTGKVHTVGAKAPVAPPAPVEPPSPAEATEPEPVAEEAPAGPAAEEAPAGPAAEEE